MFLLPLPVHVRSDAQIVTNSQPVNLNDEGVTDNVFIELAFVRSSAQF